MSTAHGDATGLASTAVAARSRSSRATAAAVPRSVQALCVGGLLVVFAWAFWPLGDPALVASKPVSRTNAASVATAREPLDLAAFQTPLWVIPPPPPAPPASAPPPPPLKLQLIAIVGPEAGHSERSALVYDPDTDKLLSVREGDALAGRKVERITELRVHIRDGAGERILALRSDGSGGPP